MNLRLGRWLGFVGVCLFSCGELPALRLVSIQEQSVVTEDCLRVFPQEAFKVVHTLEIDLPMGGRSLLLGVSAVDPQNGAIRSLIISPEGLVIFDANWDRGQIRIGRALEPLDQEGFSAGLFADVRLVFFPPIFDRVVAGRLEDGREGCRFLGPETITDLIFSDDLGFSIQLYSNQKKLLREVTLHPPFVRGFAQKMDLQAPSIIGYRMKFELLQVEPFDEQE